MRLSLSGKLDQMRESVNSSKAPSSRRGSASRTTSTYYSKLFVKECSDFGNILYLAFRHTVQDNGELALRDSEELVNRLNSKYSASRPDDR